jgi:hypothetical protein
MTLPTMSEKDVFVVYGGNIGTTTTAGFLTGGWSVADVTDVGGAVVLGYKVMTTTPDTSLVIRTTNASFFGAAFVGIAFSGADATVVDAFVQTSVSALTSQPNAPSLTVTTVNCAVLTGLKRATSAADVMVQPGTYNNLVQIKSSGASNQQMQAGLAWILRATSGAEDPTTWDGITTTSSAAHVSAISLRPFVASNTVFPFYKTFGIESGVFRGLHPIDDGA